MTSLYEVFFSLKRVPELKEQNDTFSYKVYKENKCMCIIVKCLRRLNLLLLLLLFPLKICE